MTQAWTAAEAALPLGWQVSGLYRFGELWIGLAEGPAFDDYASGSGQYAEQALRRLSDRLRERRGAQSWLRSSGGFIPVASADAMIRTTPALLAPAP
jgi:hypothetical protein